MISVLWLIIVMNFTKENANVNPHINTGCVNDVQVSYIIRKLKKTHFSSVRMCFSHVNIDITFGLQSLTEVQQFELKIFRTLADNFTYLANITA